MKLEFECADSLGSGSGGQVRDGKLLCQFAHAVRVVVEQVPANLSEEFVSNKKVARLCTVNQDLINEAPGALGKGAASLADDRDGVGHTSPVILVLLDLVVGLGGGTGSLVRPHGAVHARGGGWAGDT